MVSLLLSGYVFERWGYSDWGYAVGSLDMSEICTETVVEFMDFWRNRLDNIWYWKGCKSVFVGSVDNMTREATDGDNASVSINWNNLSSAQPLPSFFALSANVDLYKIPRTKVERFERVRLENASEFSSCYKLLMKVEKLIVNGNRKIVLGGRSSKPFDCLACRNDVCFI